MVHIAFYIIFVVLIYTSVLFFIYDAGNDFYDDKNIYILDNCFKILPDLGNNKNIVLTKKILFMSTIMYFLFIVYKNDNRNAIINEYIKTVSIVVLIKSCLILFTIIPNPPSSKCKKLNIFNPLKGSCHDLLISTHSVLLFSIVFTLLHYTKKMDHKLFPFYIAIPSIIILMLSLRQHYTCDVLNALFYCYFVNFFINKSQLY
jgi:hypothetical protein